MGKKALGPEILGLGPEIYKMSLEYPVVTESKKREGREGGRKGMSALERGNVG